MAVSRETIQDLYFKNFGEWLDGPELDGLVQQFANSTQQRVEQWMLTRPAAQQPGGVYMQRYSTIQDTALAILGYPLDAQQVYDWITRGMSDDEIMWRIRTSDSYQRMFAGKPAWMTEAEYRRTREEMVSREPEIRAGFRSVFGKELSRDDLQKIFYGGPFSEKIRSEWVQVQAAVAGREELRGKLQNTGVKDTYLGPVQPLMAGIKAQTPSAGPEGNTYEGVLTPRALDEFARRQFEATIGSGPQNKWASYKDWKLNKVNPNWQPSSLYEHQEMQSMADRDHSLRFGYLDSQRGTA